MPIKIRPQESLKLIHPRSLKYMSKYLQSLVEGRLWLKIFIGMFLGIAVGLLLGPTYGLVDPVTATILGEWLALPGYIFLGLLQMIVIPLVFASIIRGIAAGEDIEQLKKVGLRVVGYFLITTVIAVFIGLGLATTIQPGQYISSDAVRATMGDVVAPVDVVENEISNSVIVSIPMQIGSLLPTNPLAAMVSGQMLQVVLFSIIVGIALVSMAPQQSKPLLDLLGSVQEVSMLVVKWSMLLAPFAVFGLLAKFTLNIGIEALLGMTVYVGTVLLGLLLLFSLYMLILYIVASMNPFVFLRSVHDVLLLAFSTSSSAAVMPLSIKTAEDKLGVRPSVSQFVVPLGATINMNGTALYQGVAAVFLAQVFGVDLGFGEMLLIVITVVAASIGTPATPGVGIVILAMILTSVGIPASGIALIIGVDRILDMSRTSVNVAGDLVACSVMEKWVGGEKSVLDEIAQEQDLEQKRELIDEDVIIDSSNVIADDGTASV
ncbi:sodium:dicarboxylate symporter [Methanosalsum zhilinae DSM 4017]|uniref:Sodium:dicarboxylate symporter n=1 Tax=Methanosalsum zhilinae (strain DSM 4017 / NBRC 107636 / OCM 62 / WeN5) TaxID=679901 RepID=F7XK68_METZD|nr:dicarboxylate/amino acid:cation symporter [Methanosalsum zhilinae]AEH60533.1 sodium:dicarboxylate symporter [Methanosalsum zhilinae DSM 4017]